MADSENKTLISNPEAVNKSKMSDEVVDTNPYSRLMALKRMGIVANYEDIQNFTVIIVGIGGVGSVTAEMLVRCGIGKLILYDYDKVELANMNRLFYQPCHCGMFKVDAASEVLKNINPNVIIECHKENITSIKYFGQFIAKINEGSLNGLKIDLLLCCVDNFQGRMTVNTACNEVNQVWIESGVSENAISGHIQFVQPGKSACYACVPPLLVASNIDEKTLKRDGVCSASLPTTMGIIAGLLVQTALKFLLKFGTVSNYIGYNALSDFFPLMSIKPNSECSDINCIRWQKLRKCSLTDINAEKVTQKIEAKEIFENPYGIEMTEEGSDDVVSENSHYNWKINKNKEEIDSSSETIESLMSKLKNL